MGAPLLVISPHLDDAVLSCGEFLAARPETVVVTLFAGVPENDDQLTEWDAASGFCSAREAVMARRAEDEAALGILGAIPRWLHFCDAQYGHSPDMYSLVSSLEEVLAHEQPRDVVMPLGLYHADHQLAHQAALSLLRQRPTLGWFAYEDIPYRRLPGLVENRLAGLGRAGIAAIRITARANAHRALKRRAVRCYASQLRALSTPGRPGHEDAFTGETYWRLAVSDSSLLAREGLAEGM